MNTIITICILSSAFYAFVLTAAILRRNRRLRRIQARIRNLT